MALIDAFFWKNVSWDTVVNMVGGTNANLNGADRPTTVNGIFKFTPYTANTGDWARIELPTSFNHAAGDTFSILMFRNCPTVNPSNTTAILFQVYSLTETGYLRITLYNAAGIPYTYGYSNGSTSWTSTSYIGKTAETYKRWDTMVYARQGASLVDLWSEMRSQRQTNTIVGNMYNTSAERIIGCRVATGGYAYSTNEQVLWVLHFNHKLTNSEISNYNGVMKWTLL